MRKNITVWWEKNIVVTAQFVFSATLVVSKWVCMWVNVSSAFVKINFYKLLKPWQKKRNMVFQSVVKVIVYLIFKVWSKIFIEKILSKIFVRNASNVVEVVEWCHNNSSLSPWPVSNLRLRSPHLPKLQPPTAAVSFSAASATSTTQLLGTKWYTRTPGPPSQPWPCTHPPVSLPSTTTSSNHDSNSWFPGANPSGSRNWQTTDTR